MFTTTLDIMKYLLLFLCFYVVIENSIYAEIITSITDTSLHPKR